MIVYVHVYDDLLLTDVVDIDNHVDVDMDVDDNPHAHIEVDLLIDQSQS